jgi:hypothetical protein
MDFWTDLFFSLFDRPNPVDGFVYALFCSFILSCIHSPCNEYSHCDQVGVHTRSLSSHHHSLTLDNTLAHTT